MLLKELRLTSNIANIVTNCYIVEDEKTKETIVIDPAGECNKIIELLDVIGANLKYIYLTHCHGDHIGAVEELKNTKGGKIRKSNEIEAQTKHDIGALVKGLGEVCENDAGEYVHFGATSNDVVDSSNSLLIRDSIEVLKEKIIRLTNYYLN